MLLFRQLNLLEECHMPRRGDTNNLRDISLLKLFKIEIDEANLEEILYLYILFVGAFFIFLSATVSWIQLPSQFLRVLIQYFFSFFCVFLIYIAKKHKIYFIFSFNLLTLAFLAYLFFPAGGVRGTIIFYLVANLVLTWLLLSNQKYKVILSTFLHIAVFYIDLSLQIMYPEWIPDRYPSVRIQVFSWMIHGGFIFTIVVIFMRVRSVQNEKFIKSFIEKVEIDQLTGAYSRGFIIKLIESHQKNHAMHHARHSIAFFDIDKFKSINDSPDLGHLVGDEILKDLVSLAYEMLRKTDYIGRYGGDEFILFFPYTKKEEAAIICDRFRKRVSEKFWTSKMIRTSISIGVDEVHPHRSIESTIDLVDKKMYKAKALGRNTVIS